jgi:signal transduction histidine kinase
MENASRPWYTYLLLFIGGLVLLGALFQPVAGFNSTAPGAVVGPNRTLLVRPGSPLARAGVRTGDRFMQGETVRAPDSPMEEGGRLRWSDRVPKAGKVGVLRGGKLRTFAVRPAAPAWPVRLGWFIVGLLNVGLVLLALSLFWQRPGEGPALLLGLVLLSAPVFAYPGEPRLLALIFAAHFFTIFPPPAQEPEPGRRTERRRPVRWGLLVGIYLPFLFFGLMGLSLAGQGRSRAGAGVFALMALGYAGYSLARVLSRWRRVAEADRPVIRTLTVAAGAMLAAVALALPQRLWLIADQFVPANLVPAVIFSAAVARLVFRLQVLQVRVMARRTLQYLLARWTLGSLFLIPGLLLVLGFLAAPRREPKPGEVFWYLLWMFVAAMLLIKRQSVLRNLDRRFFRDIDAARQALIRLAQDLGRQKDAEGVLLRLESGVRQALNPVSLRFTLPDVPAEKDAELVVPLLRGETVLGCLQLGAKESREAYTAEERELLGAAAVQAAMALENARLSAALLARQRAELTARTAGVLAGAEEERRRLAADLHDQVLPELRHIAGEVDRLKGHANGLAPDLERLERDVRGTMDSVREVMEALRPSALDMLGLADALESYFRKGAARCSPPLAVSVRRAGEEPLLAAGESLALYRICQEAINNVLKHSGAARAGLEVRNEAGVLSLVIWDDGRGLDVEACAGKGHGLSNIRYRADLVGATVEWSSAEGGGTRVEVRLSLTAIGSAPGQPLV